MRVVLGPTLLAQPPTPGRDTALLAASLAEHELYYDDSAGDLADSPLYVQLCAECKWIRDHLDQARPFSAAPRRPRLVIGGHLHRSASVASAEAAKVLGPPLVVLVEDIENDGRFVDECLRRKWPGDEPSLRALRARLEIDHGGGGRIDAVLAAQVAARRRVVVVVDSDRNEDLERERNVLCGDTAQKAHDAVTKLGSPLVELLVLDRREAENYISEEEVVAWGKNNSSPGKLLRAWQIGGRWRWYFDMKKGRRSRASVSVPADVEALLGTHNFGNQVCKALVDTVRPRERRLLDHDLATDIDRLLELIQELT